MAKLRDSNAQPLGWTERRASLRSEHGGVMWRQIFFDFDPSARKRKHLETLAALEIDFLTRGELYDYLKWVSQESDVEISDLYRMYLGYEAGELQASE